MVRRRARQARASSLSPNSFRNMTKGMRKAAGEALRSATREILSDLYDLSPAYSGEFRTKWYSQVEGRSNKVFIAVGVPRFTDDQLKKGAPTILIGNTSPYAQEAMDLIPGKFRSQKEDPIKEPVAIGRRTGKKRGHVKDLPLSEIEKIIARGKKPAYSTAELDWYDTYMNGGGFSEAFRQGAKSGFIRPVQQ